MTGFANLVRRYMAARPGAGTSDAVSPAAPQRLALDVQWSRLVGFLTASQDRLVETRRYHAAAEDQLDAAAYALGELVDDLAAVMALPARRTTPAVYQLPQPVPASRVVLARRRAAAA